MDARARPVIDLFETRCRLEVPLFQRPYVWNEEEHWQPLWEDIERKFADYLQDRVESSPAHFLGAMVLDQKRTATSNVEKRSVIDGQQRLTTLQLFLAALRDLSGEHGLTEMQEEFIKLTRNQGKLAAPEFDKYKVWPTESDRAQFRDVLDAGSRTALEKLHPLVYQPRRKYPDDRPKMVEAYMFYHDKLTQFFLGTTEETPLAADVPLEDRLNKCLLALSNALKVVVIDLGEGDDAQVIFETLNARGQPLLPADLLRNYVFLRAARRKESEERLYKTYWKPFDEAFWREEVKQGRLSRPRSDLFIQHYLASRTTNDIPIKHLFGEYKHWIERASPFGTVEAELQALAAQGADFKRIVAPSKDEPLRSFFQFLDAFDVRTVYPLLLHVFHSGASAQEWQHIARVLESYLLRRAVCGLTTKNYNRTFLTLTRAMHQVAPTAEAIGAHLAQLTGDSTEWPRDDRFKLAWMNEPLYEQLNNPKNTYILRRLNDAVMGRYAEQVELRGELTLEHLLPQDWLDHWPLSDGSKGYTEKQLVKANADDPTARATMARDQALQTIGNLTLLTRPLNTKVSNGPWVNKRATIMEHSLLPLNRSLSVTWDEASISARSSQLFSKALDLWPAPPINQET